MVPQSGAADPPAPSDRKKRALEALERRFAVAKAEVLQEPHHKGGGNRKRAPKAKGEPETEKPRGGGDASLADPATNRGNLVFSGYTPRRETLGSTESHPAYTELSQMVHENLLRAGSKDSSKGDAVNKIVYNLLQNSDKGQKYIRGARSMKIDSWLLLDNFVPKDSASMNARVRALQSHAKRSRRRMSMRQHRKCGSLDLPKEFHNFDRFKQMHEMWKEYIIELVKETGKKQLAQCLLMADLHGAIFLVVECKTTAFKGVTGIMIRETAETFGIITQDNRFRVVPKRGSVFVFQAGGFKITLHGDKLSSRNSGA